MTNDYFDYIEPIPIDALDTCGKEEKEYNPFCDNSSEKIGNTNYIISVFCEGTEAMLEKSSASFLMIPQQRKKIIHDNSFQP